MLHKTQAVPHFMRLMIIGSRKIAFSFDKTDRVTGRNCTYDDLVQSMRTNGWKGDPVDVVKCLMAS